MTDKSSVRPLRELIALMVHDLSNPLQSLSMLLELAQDDVDPSSEAHERLVEASRAAVAMRTLVRGLGDFNRSARAGDEVPAARLVSSTLGVLQRRFSRQGIELIDQPRDLDEHTQVDAQFQLLFLTLLLSALAADADPNKARSLTVSTPSPTSLQIAFKATDPNGVSEAWPLSTPHILHAQQLAEALGLRLETIPSRATVWFP